MMSKFRPRQPIVAATPKEKTFHQLALAWGVHPILTKYENNWDALMSQAFSGIKESGMAKEGDTIVLSAGLPLQTSGKTNLVQVEKL